MRRGQTGNDDSRFLEKLVEIEGAGRNDLTIQANRKTPGMRLFRYREGFAAAWAEETIAVMEGPIVDPFAGAGTSGLCAWKEGKAAIGIEALPVGVGIARAVAALAQKGAAGRVKEQGQKLVAAMLDTKGTRRPLAASRITQGAYPVGTREELERAHAWLEEAKGKPEAVVLGALCMSVLEEVSYTRKDGQYLRWDTRSGRDVRGPGTDKGWLSSAAEAVDGQIVRAVNDAGKLEETYAGKGGEPKVVWGSCLQKLARIESGTVGGLVTSPPYANRYDYTRTYALELGWLGADDQEIKRLRQEMLTSTVESKRKSEVVEAIYAGEPHYEAAKAALGGCTVYRKARQGLEERKEVMANRNVIRMVEGYLEEMAVVVSQLARVARQGAKGAMVNDNVCYEGVEVPVDLILCEVAEGCGWRCDSIEMLAGGKGNSSQQMARYGRKEMRKTIYHWTKT